MAEYIDRKALRAAIADELFIDDSTKAVFRNIANKVPTITPESLVRHGRWLDTTKWWQGGSVWKKCSVCGILNCNKSNYCPNCGAKMDLEE